MLSLWKGDILAPQRNKNQIGQMVAEAHGLTVEDLKGRSKVKKIAWPRQEAMYLMTEEVNPDGSPRWSFFQIGEWFHRDHSTVVHAANAHAKRYGLVRSRARQKG